LLGRFVGDAIGSAAEENGERGGVVAGLRNRSEDDGLEMDSVADGDHDFLKSEERLGRGLRGLGRLLGGGRDSQQQDGEKQMGSAQRFSP